MQSHSRFCECSFVCLRLISLFDAVQFTVLWVFGGKEVCEMGYSGAIGLVLRRTGPFLRSTLRFTSVGRCGYRRVSWHCCLHHPRLYLSLWRWFIVLKGVLAEAFPDTMPFAFLDCMHFHQNILLLEHLLAAACPTAMLISVSKFWAEWNFITTFYCCRVYLLHSLSW